MNRDKKLRAVSVSCTNDGDEYWTVGRDDVTAIEWSSMPGQYIDLPTISVFRNGQLASEHPFANILGVYYEFENK